MPISKLWRSLNSSGSANLFLYSIVFSLVAREAGGFELWSYIFELKRHYQEFQCEWYHTQRRTRFDQHVGVVYAYVRRCI
jgi:hypothetical protein